MLTFSGMTTCITKQWKVIMVIKLTLFAQVKRKDFYLYLLPEYNTEE